MDKISAKYYNPVAMKSIVFRNRFRRPVQFSHEWEGYEAS